MNRVVSTLFSLLLLASLQACGQKGPLYLPDQQAQALTPTSESSLTPSH